MTEKKRGRGKGKDIGRRVGKAKETGRWADKRRTKVTKLHRHRPQGSTRQCSVSGTELGRHL